MTNYKTDPTPGPPITVTHPDDPAYALLMDDHTTTPVEGVYRSDCFICRDPEFAQMGLPLCNECPDCTRRNDGKVAGHVPADDPICSDCGFDYQEWWMENNEH